MLTAGQPEAELTAGKHLESAIDMSFGQSQSVIKMMGLTKVEQANEPMFTSICEGALHPSQGGYRSMWCVVPAARPQLSWGDRTHEKFKLTIEDLNSISK